nr:hypothetical protein Iba_chr03fCG2250 [Ipomoea batatas]
MATRDFYALTNDRELNCMHDSSAHRCSLACSPGPDRACNILSEFMTGGRSDQEGKRPGNGDTRLTIKSGAGAVPVDGLNMDSLEFLMVKVFSNANIEGHQSLEGSGVDGVHVSAQEDDHRIGLGYDELPSASLRMLEYDLNVRSATGLISATGDFVWSFEKRHEGFMSAA